MTITVYYGEQFNYPTKEPTSVLREIKTREKKSLESNSNMGDLIFCPAFTDYYKNIFSIKNIHDWSITREDSYYFSRDFSPETFNKYFLNRNEKIGFFSFFMPSLYLIPDRSVQAEFLQPTLSNSDINKKTNIVQGTFNLYKHIRPTETSFLFKEKYDTIKCRTDDDLYYVKFNTNEKIKFKRFFCNDEFNKIVDMNLANREFNTFNLPLKWWYEINELTKQRKRLMEIVKNNLE